MKQRVITALVSVLVFLGAMLGYYTPALNVIIAVLIGLSMWELFHATGLLKHKALYMVSTVYAVLIPFFPLLPMEGKTAALVCTGYAAAYVFIVIAITMKQHDTLNFSESCMAIVISHVFPLSFLTLVLTREVEPVYGIYYIFVACFLAWGGDTLAYFTGRFLGKHKLAPVISPKKTVEGVIGGIFGSILFVAIISGAFSLIMNQIGMPVTIRYAVILPVSGLLSLVSVFGDLSCSLIKRQYKIKDYGTIFPGHGGVMDRFDSVLMVAPFIYFFMNICPVVFPA